ncbi:E3 ubiquitin-protein ligase TRIM47-like [Trichomycterus rosablanca]|uniref:E3 ubiquitin-protein ligase TRIM47-like n=1 Tax=Trichomycterus rosablanca TaxID=2290929 RepID=UPI002F3507E9
MAKASISVDEDQFNCLICLDLMKDPVTAPCGHSYCMVCINTSWNHQRRVYSCPHCRESFNPKPVLRRNNMLAEVVQKLKAELETSASGSASTPYAGPGDLECDLCTGRKRKATESCLTCVATFCETHLKPHTESPALKKHKLVKATKLQEKMCPQHDEVLKIYCRTDQSCICYLCMLHEHKGHDTVAAVAEKNVKESELKKVLRKSNQRISDNQKKVKELKMYANTIKGCAQIAVDDSMIIFTELISFMEKKRSRDYQDDQKPFKV